MFEKVLVAMDFSIYSQHILDNVPGIPGIREVVLLHVVDGSQPSRRGWVFEPQIENAKLLMAEKKVALVHSGNGVQLNVNVLVTAITQGNIPETILKTAEEHDVSLIVVGSRGKNPIRELLLGSVSSSVVRHAKTNVLVLHFNPLQDDTDTPPCPPRRDLFSEVLVPTDFSDSAGKAFSLVKTIPGLQKAILLNVVSRGETHEEIEGFVSDAQSKLEAMRKECDEGVAVTTHVRVGDPAEKIISVAHDDDVSLIAMSAFGTGWLRETLLGSTTFTVVRKTKRPVLVIRTPAGK